MAWLRRKYSKWNINILYGIFYGFQSERVKKLNRRQKKKQFKKIYGMTPEQYNKYIQEHWSEIYAEVAKAACEGINMGLERIRVTAVEAVKEMRNIMDEWTKVIKEAAGAIERYYRQEGEKQDGDNGINS